MFNIELSLEHILRRAFYKIDFTNLAKVFVEEYEKKGIGKLNVFERLDETFVSLKTSWENKTFNDMVALLFSDNSMAKEQPLLLFNISFIESSYDHHLIYPFKKGEEYTFVLVFSFKDKQEALKAMEVYETTFQDIFALLRTGYDHEKFVQQSERRDILLQVMKTFYQTLNSEVVLTEVSNVIKKIFPNFQISLWLTQEWQANSSDLHVQPFLFGRGTDILAEKAYLTGDVQIEGTDRDLAIFVPLQGKQGVYGVMEIFTTDRNHLPSYEIEFIKMLAFTGGMALENAELYKKSHKLVKDLQLINETTHQLNSSLRLNDMVQYMKCKIIDSFQAEEIGFIMFIDDNPIILDGSTPYFHEFHWSDDLVNYINELKETKEPLYLGNINDHPFTLGDYQSALIIPMIENNEVKGIVFVLHHDPFHFSFDEFRLLQSLIQQATLAFTNSLLHEELERLVNTDYLTKLYTRGYLDNLIEHSLQEEENGAFLLLDIDNFKGINDKYGHHVGDQTIISVANIVVECVGDKGYVARWGGEEIAIYMPGRNSEQATEFAERIVKRVREGTEPRVTVSIGVADWHRTDNNKSLFQLFNQADEALYEAKENGKDRVVVSG